MINWACERRRSHPGKGIYFELGSRPGPKHSSMGTFHVGCKLENHVDRTKTVTVPRILVDSGSEYTWIPARTLAEIGVSREKKDLTFTMANGQSITRSVGFAILRVDESFTIDEVVFGEPGDLTILGARTLEGLSLVVDARGKKLVSSGPLLAASVARLATCPLRRRPPSCRAGAPPAKVQRHPRQAKRPPYNRNLPATTSSSRCLKLCSGGL